MSGLTLRPEDVERHFATLDVDDWLGLWHTSQGGERRQGRLDQLAALLPLQVSAPVRVLDMFSGPGDVGRTVARRFPSATVDCIDGDPVLLGMCRLANARAGVAGRILQRDAWQADWRREIEPNYDAICTVAALHWFDRKRFSELLSDFYDLLRPGGFLVFSEPISVPTVFRRSLACWEQESGACWDPAAWDAFLDRAWREFAHAPKQPDTAPNGQPVIGDEGISVRETLDRLDAAGFESSDVIARRGSVATFVTQRPS